MTKRSGIPYMSLVGVVALLLHSTISSGSDVCGYVLNEEPLKQIAALELKIEELRASTSYNRAFYETPLKTWLRSLRERVFPSAINDEVRDRWLEMRITDLEVELRGKREEVDRLIGTSPVQIE